MYVPPSCPSSHHATQNVQGKDSEPCVKLTDWCMSTGLVTELAECALVLLSLDPAPYLANGRRLFSRLTAVVVITMNCTRELDSLVHSRCVGQQQQQQR